MLYLADAGSEDAAGTMVHDLFQTEQGDASPPPQRLRVGFGIVGVTMAVVLLAATLSTWLGARELSRTVTTGQAVLLLSMLHQRHRPVSSEGLTHAAEGAWELGLIHAGVYTPEAMSFGIGEPTRAFVGEEIRAVVEGGVLEERSDDGRAVAWSLMPLPNLGLVDGGPPPDGRGPPPDGRGPPPDGRGPPPDGKAPPPDGRAPPPPGAPRFHLVIEFEPIYANALRARANRMLIVGIAGALIMVLAALVFWWLSLRFERAEGRAAQQRQLALLGEMSAVMAHELRNPLASLKGHAQLLEERLIADGVDDRTQRKAARVVAEAQRLEALTRGLLSFVKLGEISREEVEPARVVEAALADLDGDRVELDLATAPLRWSLDRLRMQQVLSNLIDNALQATEDPQARVRVRVLGDRRGCVFEVRDRGPGVPAAARAQIFEPFHTTRVRGTGLGLAVARRIVELHGGTIGVDDHPEGGAVFTVVIPKPRAATSAKQRRA